MNVLFLEENGLNKLDTIAELHSLGINIIVATERKKTRNDNIDDYVHTDFHNLDRLISDITNYMEYNHIKINYIVTYTEFLVETSALLNNYFGLNGLSYRAAKIARNKYLTKAVVSKDDICEKFIPDYKLISCEQDLDELDFEKYHQFILKPINCAASFGLYKVSSKEEATHAYEMFKKTDDEELSSRLNYKANNNYLLAEQYVDGYEISVESISLNGRTTNYVVHDKVYPVEAPLFLEECLSSYSARITEELKKEIIDATNKVLNCIGFDNGVSHVEFRIKNNRPYLIEINSRPGGGLIVESVFYSTGINLIVEYIKGLISGKLSEPIMNAYSINRSIYPGIGRVKSVHGVDDLYYKDTCVKLVKNTCNVGSVVTTPEASGNIEILLAGDDYNYIYSVMSNMENQIKIIME